jgi:hypothetical protein
MLALAEKTQRRRRRHGIQAVRGLHRAAPDVDGRHDDAIGLEPVEREDSPDDVDDRVERADFVQVDLLHRHVVDGGFRFREPIEERRRTRFPMRSPTAIAS